MKTTYEFAKELIQQVNPTDSYKGENYDVWKKDARAKLSSLLGMDKFTKVAPETEIEYTEKIVGGEKIRFTFQSEAGYRVPCYMLLPDGMKYSKIFTLHKRIKLEINEKISQKSQKYQKLNKILLNNLCIKEITGEIRTYFELYDIEYCTLKFVDVAQTVLIGNLICLSEETEKRII